MNNARSVRNLFLLSLAFVVGIVLSRYLRFSNALLNYIFGWALLCIPFVALRPISKLPKFPRIIAFVVVSPLLVLCLFATATSIACDFDLHPYSKDSCQQELSKVEEAEYSVHLILDSCGGATQNFILDIEQRALVMPGLYLVRSVDAFDGAHEGKMTYAGANKIRVHIPKGVEGSGWNREVDRTYTLKKHVYF